MFCNVLDINESNIEDFDNQRISNFIFHKEDDIRCITRFRMNSMQWKF